MDLYEFINTTLIPTKKEEPVLDTTEEVAIPKEIDTPPSPSENEILKNRIKDLETLVEVLQSERSEITSRLKNTEYDKASLEGLIQELKEKQSYLIEQIKAVKEEKDSNLINEISDLKKEIQSLLQEKMEVLNSNKQLESTIETLNKERQDLENTLKNLLSEKDQLLKKFESNTAEKDKYIDEIKKSISLLQVELKEKQLIIERLTESNIEHKSHIDDIKREYAKYKQNTIFVIIALIVVTIITIIIVMNNRIQQRSSTLMQPPIQKTQQSNEVKKEIPTGEATTSPSNTTSPTTSEALNSTLDKQKTSPNISSKDNGSNKVDKKVSDASKEEKTKTKDQRVSNKTPFTLKTQGFKVSLKPIKKEDLFKLHIPSHKISNLNNEQAYVISIKTKRQLIDYDFKKSPSISFIYEGEDKSKPVQIISVNYKKSKKDGSVKITTVIITDRADKPIALVVGPMNKDKLKIIVI